VDDELADEDTEELEAAGASVADEDTEELEAAGASVADGFWGRIVSFALLKSFSKAAPLLVEALVKADFLGGTPEGKDNTVFESVRIISSNDREDYAIARPTLYSPAI
jgi:hypothetical protein